MEVVSTVEAPPATPGLSWPPAPPRIELADGEVHVWSAWIGGAAGGFAANLGMLSDNERARSAKFHFESDRKNFIARRSLLRVILGRYLNLGAAEVPLAYEERGKPRVAFPFSAPPLHFNFSHSRNLALCAVGRFAPLGVDVEKIRPMPEMMEIGADFCSGLENDQLRTAPLEMKLEVFFSIWTRKEAYLKATGEGIAGALAQLDCSQAPPGWSLHTLSPAAGYIGALAFAGGPARPLCWQWDGRKV